MNSTSKYTWLLLTLGFFHTITSAAEPTDWVNQPDIKRIRAIYIETEAAIKKRQLKRIAAPKNCFAQSNHGLSEAYTQEDSKQAVHKLFIAYGSEDSVGQIAYYYDHKGKHRFTYQYVGAVNDTRQENRTYFDENGKELHRDVRLLEGPGYPTGIESYVPNPKQYLLKLCQHSGT